MPNIRRIGRSIESGSTSHFETSQSHGNDSEARNLGSVRIEAERRRFCSMSTVGPMQWSHNVEISGLHHRLRQVMASSSLHCHRLVKWGRRNELEASMVGAARSHVLRSLFQCCKIGENLLGNTNIYIFYFNVWRYWKKDINHQYLRYWAWLFQILKMNIQDTKLLNILVSKLECLRY